MEKKNDARSGLSGCGSPMVLLVFFVDSRGIFQFVKKIQTKKYLFFDEKKILENNFPKFLGHFLEIFDFYENFIKGL